jgi:hypothetical protein
MTKNAQKRQKNDQKSALYGGQVVFGFGSG